MPELERNPRAPWLLDGAAVRARLIAAGALRERAGVLRIDETGLRSAAIDIAETEDVSAALDCVYTDYRISRLLRTLPVDRIRAARERADQEEWDRRHLEEQ